MIIRNLSNVKVFTPNRIFKNIKDYLHLYLGCRLKIGEGSWADNAPHTFDAHLRSIELGTGLPIKLVLRPLSDMTEEEMDEMWLGMPGGVQISLDYKSGKHIHFDITPDQVRFLLSKHFDLFGLIDAGLAIKKSD